MLIGRLDGIPGKGERIVNGHGKARQGKARLSGFGFGVGLVDSVSLCLFVPNCDGELFRLFPLSFPCLFLSSAVAV